MSQATAPRPLLGSPRLRLAAGVLATLLLLAVLGADRIGGRGGAPEFEAAPDVLRAAVAAVALFAVCGWAPTQVLTPDSLRPHRALLVLPVGAAVSALALTLLGVFQVPLPVSIAVLFVAGGAFAIAVRRRRSEPPGPRARRLDLLLPAGVALLLAVLLVSPLLRNDSFATVLGQNGDAHMATGAAVLLQEAPPGAERPDLPIDHMPIVWQSKYPIYYVLAAVSTLSGLDPVQSFATLSAVLGGLVALGFYLLAVGAFGAVPAAALAGMALVALDRIVLRIVLDPFYNQLWALLSFPFVLLFGWLYLRSPSRGGATLLAMFLAVSVFAYPLLAPFPALFLAVGAWITWRERRAEGERPRWVSALRLPRSRRSLLVWIPAGLLLGPILLLLFLAALEKMGQALRATLPGGDLAPWSGDSPGFLPLGAFIGVPPHLEALGLVVVAAAVYGLTRLPRDVRWPTGIMAAALALGAVWFYVRGAGQLFHFKALSFVGPLAVLLAGIGLVALGRAARRPVRLAGWGVLAVLLAINLSNARHHLRTSFPHVTPQVWELREWSKRLPPGASVRVDPTPVGVQQWAGYMLADRPISAARPLQFFFPHPVVGRKADYILVNAEAPRPPDAAGPAEMRNKQFKLYRQRPGVPGPDRSSRTLVDPLRGQSAPVVE